MKLKKLFVMTLVTLILSAALGVTAMAEIDPHPWAIEPDSIIDLAK